MTHEEYQTQMNDMALLDSSITAIDRYIEMTENKVEIISIDGECYIKYLDEE